MPHPLKRTDVRLGLVCAFGAAALGLGAFVLGTAGTDRPLGQPLAIAVVAPIEPEVSPGSTMDVGALNDSFDKAALERVADVTPLDTLPDAAWVGPPLVWLGDAETARAPAPVVDPPAAQPLPAATPSDPLADGSKAFGFDRLQNAHAGAASTSPAPAAEQNAARHSSGDVLSVQYSSE